MGLFHLVDLFQVLFILDLFSLFFQLINREDAGHMEFLVIWLGLLLLGRCWLLDLNTGGLEHGRHLHGARQVHLRLLLQLLLGLQKLLLI
mmetsp:Transcript_20645/g.19638  ORF Transcript_20645/g.19638 Transcript_20645/m.19638 type:complete len:90 (+) Transcript_20645:876-1145(+)